MADWLIIKDVTLKGRLTDCVWLKNTGAINRDIVYPELKNRADALYYAKGKLQRTVAGELLLEESLSRLEDEFDDHFLRIHSNCLVARNRILEVGKLPGADDGHFLRLWGWTKGCRQPSPIFGFSGQA